jgi:predicted permease
MITVAIPSGEQKQVFMPMVYGNYFKTMGIPVVAGRDFSARDLVENAPPVVVVNESFARLAFPNESAVGKPCLVPNRSRQPCEIIGVVKDSRYANLRAEPPATAYSPFLQTPTGRGQMALHVRVAGDPNALLRRVREEVQSVDKDLPMFDIHTLAEEIDAALIQERLMATLSSSFSTLALLLAGVGLYGLLAFTVVQRTGELGIRMALGATRGNVLWMVLREALSLALIGVVIGVPAALAAARFATSQIAGLFFGLDATDPVPIAVAALILTLVAALAGYFPARRAAQVDPMVALRNE